MRVFLAVLFAMFAALAPPAALAQSKNDVSALPYAEVTGADRAAFFAARNFKAFDIDEDRVAVHSARLPWQRSVELYRATGGWEPQQLIFYYLRLPGGEFVPLDGTSAPIHKANAAHPPSITKENAAKYLWYFTFFVRGPEGPFLIVESARDTFVPRGPFTGARLARGFSRVEDTFEPTRCYQRGRDHACSAVIFYGNGVMKADLMVLHSGMVEMLNDTVQANNLPVKPFAPVAFAEVKDQFKPLADSPATGVAAVEGQIANDLFQTLRALDEGRTVRLSHDNMPFLAGMASTMMEQCGMPRSAATRTRLAAFVATSSVGAMLGFNYSDPNLGKAIGTMGRQQGLLASGALAIRTMGCNPGLDRIGENMAKLINANSSADSGFVDSCAGVHGRQSCTCLANIGRQVIPDIAERRYSPRLVKQIIEGNPFIGLMAAMTCGITRY